MDVFPTAYASTCALVLTLSTKYHDDTAQFQEEMVYALQKYGNLDCINFIKFFFIA